MIRISNYDVQEEQPLQPSSTNKLISNVPIFFLKAFNVFVDLISGDNVPHNLGPR